MKITIITATYNSKEHISSVLQAIQSQCYNDIEFIVIDGGSTDGTLEAVKSCGFVTHYISEPDQGIYDALNKGIKRATGEIVGFLHSDDLFASNNILSQIVMTFENTQVDGVYGDLQYVNKEDTTKVIRYWKSKPFHPKLLRQGWMPAHPTLFLKKEVYEKHGTFNLNYNIAADYDFMLRILKDETLKFLYLPHVITKMRVGGASNRSLKNIIKKTKEDYRAITYHNVGGICTVLRKNTSKIKQFF